MKVYKSSKPFQYYICDDDDFYVGMIRHVRIHIKNDDWVEFRRLGRLILSLEAEYMYSLKEGLI